MRKSFYFLIFISLVGIFYVLNQSLPFVMDDALYAHIYPENPVFNGHPHNLDVDQEIQSLSDVFESQWHHYFTKNGRGLVHTIVQTFCGLLGKNAYNVFAALMFALFGWLLGKTCLGGNFSQWGKSIISLTIFSLLIPEPTCLYNGIAYGVNYLWSSVFCLMFLYLFWSDKRTRLETLLLWFMAFVAGWSHEGLVIGIGAGLIAWLWQRRFRVSPHQWGALVLFAIGACLLVLAPSNFGRAASMSGDGAEWAGGVMALHFRAFAFLRASYILIALFLVLLFTGKSASMHFFRENLIWLTAWIISIVFITAVGALNVRAVYGVEFFAIILLLRVLDYISFFEKRFHTYTFAASCIAVIGGLFIASEQVKAGRQYDSIDTKLTATSNQECLVLVDDINLAWLTRPWVCHYKFEEPWENWEERVLTWRYGKKHVLIAQVATQPESSRLSECLQSPLYKVPGQNPFYSIGEYIYTDRPLGDKVDLRLTLGTYQPNDVKSYVKWIISTVRKTPVEDIAPFTGPVEQFDFQGSHFGRVAFSAHPSRKVESVELLK